jgi:hypothetical protein
VPVIPIDQLLNRRFSCHGDVGEVVAEVIAYGEKSEQVTRSHFAIRYE